MGALKGSISVRRYQVVDPLPKPEPRQRLIKGVRAHAFVPLDPKSEHERSVGWVALADNELTELSQQDVFFTAAGGEQLRITMRIDTLKAPGGEVRRQLAVRTAELEDGGAASRGTPLADARDGRQKRKLGRREKQELKKEIIRTIRLRMLPQVKVIDLVWHLDDQRLYLWSQGKRMNELFLDLFAKSFGLRLEIEGPSRWARSTAEPPVIARLTPTPELWQGFDGLRPLSVYTEVADDDAEGAEA